MTRLCLWLCSTNVDFVPEDLRSRADSGSDGLLLLFPTAGGDSQGCTDGNAMSVQIHMQCGGLSVFAAQGGSAPPSFERCGLVLSAGASSFPSQAGEAEDRYCR